MKSKRYIRRSNKFYTILALIIVLMLLAISYATLSEVLALSGTATGSATWDVKFTSVSSTNKDGGAISGNITNEGHTATISVSDLQYPGDKREVTAVIKNNSSMPIKLTGFTPTNPAANSGITFEYVNLSTNGSEQLASGASCTYKFIVGWDTSSTSTSVNGNYSFTFTYEQDTAPSTLTPSHSH